jgi:hypothetical protein
MRIDDNEDSRSDQFEGDYMPQNANHNQTRSDQKLNQHGLPPGKMQKFAKMGAAPHRWDRFERILTGIFRI